MTMTIGNWDTDYNSENWEPEFMTIIVTWQLSVTLDSIRNSCDVSNPNHCDHLAQLKLSSREDLKYYYEVGPAYPITSQMTQVHKNEYDKLL